MGLRSRWRDLREEIRAILAAHLTPGSIGRAVGVGVFLGCLPIYGIHLGVCVLAARWLRLNSAVMYGAANISNPLFAPFLVAAETAIGEYLRWGTVAHLDPGQFEHQSLWEMVQHTPDLLWSCTIGSVVLGVVLGPLLGGVAYGVARLRQGAPTNTPDEVTP